MDCVDENPIKCFTDRNISRISSRWSKEISWLQKCENSMGSHSIYGGLYNIYHSFISECYELEVEGISVLDSLENEMERACIPRSLKENFYEEEEDDDDSPGSS